VGGHPAWAAWPRVTRGHYRVEKVWEGEPVDYRLDERGELGGVDS